VCEAATSAKVLENLSLVQAHSQLEMKLLPAVRNRRLAFLDLSPRPRAVPRLRQPKWLHGFDSRASVRAFAADIVHVPLEKRWGCLRFGVAWLRSPAHTTEHSHHDQFQEE
jgi:hypothetical protein